MPPTDFTKGLIGDTNSIIASIIWGAVGTGFAIYGWKQKAMIPLFGGIALIAGSYFFATSALGMSLFSIATIAVIFWLKKNY
ncbi:MAG TPA: hypothetical protein VG938_05745 [Verrucomicrobiae bacterium]|jgi:hypothetical protein|nr:hypothetical protein [Verrucomicrobiae bacterium]